MELPPTATKLVPSADDATAFQAFVGALVRDQLWAEAESNWARPAIAATHIIRMLLAFIAGFLIWVCLFAETFIRLPDAVKPESAPAILHPHKLAKRPKSCLILSAPVPHAPGQNAKRPGC